MSKKMLNQRQLEAARIIDATSTLLSVAGNADQKILQMAIKGIQDELFPCSTEEKYGYPIGGDNLTSDFKKDIIEFLKRMRDSSAD